MNKAVVHRNAGLDYVEKHRLEGVIYFMDDDNSYAPQVRPRCTQGAQPSLSACVRACSVDAVVCVLDG